MHRVYHHSPDRAALNAPYRFSVQDSERFRIFAASVTLFPSCHSALHLTFTSTTSRPPHKPRSTSAVTSASVRLATLPSFEGLALTCLKPQVFVSSLSMYASCIFAAFGTFTDAGGAGRTHVPFARSESDGAEAVVKRERKMLSIFMDFLPIPMTLRAFLPVKGFYYCVR